jgi:lipopolysaccharide export system permease protein
MRLHDRYLFRELLTPLAFCLGGFAVFCGFVLFTTNLGRIQESKLNLPETAAYCLASLPGFIVPILPILLLLALLIALTQHARHHEITALRAAGLSLWRLSAPYFAVGLAATGIYFGLNEFAVPACDRQAEQILNRHVNKDPAPAPGKSPGMKLFFNASAGRTWSFYDYDARTTRMGNPTVSWRDGSCVKAEYAAHTNGVWTFFGVTLRSMQSGHTNFQTKFSTVLPLPELDEKPETIQLQLKYNDSQTLSGLGATAVPLSELWELLRHNPGLPASKMHVLEADFYGRLATPWTCFVVVLIAIPFGAQSGRRNLFFGVAGSIFVGFVYFVLQHVSQGLGMNGQVPAWLAAWLPNLLFAAGGIVLTLRVR